MTIDELIQRLEAATGPSRDLANEVLFACGWTQREIGKLDNPTLYWEPPDKEHDYFRDGDQPNPLDSIDAARRLLPDDSWEWSLSWNSGLAFAEVGDPLLYMEGEAKTPAIALCIAALKARAPNPPASNN